ncbi:UNVERIFIED_CONTAM: hypothetical protein FKN15_029352 [Acipenser sinensis]
MMPSGAWMGLEKHARLQGWSLDTNGWNERLYPSINYRRGPGVSDMMPSGAWMGLEKHARLQGWSLDTNGWNERRYPSINYRRGPGVSDMMPSGAWMGLEKHARLQGWSLDTNGWNERLYPSINYRRGPGKIVAHLTSDSPALVGSNITFTARLEFPKCQKEDENGDPVYEKHCKDVDASVHPGESVYNGTSWIDDYGFGNCSNKSNCNVFPDGKPCPQRLDWRRNSYVYVWHTMGQYYQKHDRSVSSITLNTTNITLGAQLMELSVYRKSNRRKYSPAANASGIYFVTDQIPFIVNISQKNDRNASDNVFIKDADIVFNVKIHDPSYYLKAAEVSYKWDFNDGNLLITPSSVATHAYNQLMNYTVKLTVEAIFKVPCGPATPTPTSVTSNPVTVIHLTHFLQIYFGAPKGRNPNYTLVRIAKCQLTLQRAFNQSGIFCVNITLSDSASLALASTLVTIGQETKYIVPKEASVIAGTVLVVLIAVAGLVLYKRYNEYKPVNGHPGDGSVEGVTIYFSQLKVALFPGNEERNPLLQGKTDSD